MLRNRAVTLHFHPIDRTPVLPTLSGYRQILDIDAYRGSTTRKTTRVTVLGMARLNVRASYGEDEENYIAARFVVHTLRTTPPPLPPELTVDDRHVPLLIERVTDEVAKERITSFFGQTSTLLQNRSFDVLGVSLATTLPLKQVRTLLFELEGAQILEVYADRMYRLNPSYHAQRDARAPSSAVAVEAFTPDFAKLTSDGTLITLLQHRWDEVGRLMQAETPRFTLIALGSLLEGVLYARAQADPKRANTQVATPKDDQGKARPLRDWSLNDFIQVAEQAGWIHSTRGKFSHVLRDYRNFVHPREEHARKETIDAATVDIAREVLIAILKDLSS